MNYLCQNYASNFIHVAHMHAEFVSWATYYCCKYEFSQDNVLYDIVGSKKSLLVHELLFYANCFFVRRTDIPSLNIQSNS